MEKDDIEKVEAEIEAKKNKSGVKKKKDYKKLKVTHTGKVGKGRR
jgi:hypothetical protein